MKPTTAVLLSSAGISLWLQIPVFAQGIPLWTNRYDGADNSSDVASAVAVDGSGDVIVAGRSYATDSSYDYAIVKYSSNGEPLWTNRYNGPGNHEDVAYAVAVDGSGNVYVTGHSASAAGSASIDFATVAYSSAGIPLWTNRYNGPGNLIDDARALVVGPNGNVCVTGYSFGAGFSELDYATVAYSSAGIPLWTNRYNGIGNNHDFAQALAVDGSNNVIVTGWSPGSTGGPNYTTIKYSNNGMRLWTNHYNGPGNGSDLASAVAVDSNGDAIVTGSSSYPTNSSSDYATIKYSRGGVPLWTNRYNGPANLSDSARSVAVDGSGNVYVTGYSESGAESGSADYVTIAYSSAGIPLWTNRYDGPANSGDRAAAVAVDPSGNVYVTGTSESDAESGSGDYVTITYSNAGIPLWTNRYNGEGNGDDVAYAMAVDGAGNVYVTGSSPGIGALSDYATVKFSILLLPIPLNFQIEDGQIVLSWTNAAFSLQSAPTVQGNYTNIPGATSPYANPISASQQYFRLYAY